MDAAPPVCWVDGELAPAGAPAWRSDDSAAAHGRGGYTSVGVRGGGARWPDRHVQRLVRDARALGLPPPAPGLVRRAIDELAKAALGAGDGVVRIQVSCDAAGALHVVGRARGMGPDPPRWRAITSPWPHPGPCPVAPGAKQTGRLVLAAAAAAAREAGADEALLFDAAGRLVEGARSNVIMVRADGRLVTPPLARGAVAGVALGVLREHLPELAERDVSARALRSAHGVAVVNAVRGARALASLDGAALGAEGPALAERLEAAFERADCTSG